jgi:hypothetical protein
MFEQLRGSQHPGSGGNEQPSKSVKKESLYEMAMQDDRDHKTSRSMFIGNESLETSQTIMAGIASLLEGETN